MKYTRCIKTILCIWFVIALIGSLLCVFIAGTFSPKAVEQRLRADGFYTFAEECVIEELSALQGVIGVRTEDLREAVSKEQLEPLLRTYTTAVSRHLLYGEQTEQTVSFQSDAVYDLVCATITEEHYHGNAAQMEADRRDAYADLIAAVNGTLRFFPEKLYASATNILENGGVRLQVVYTVVRIARIAMWPLVLLTLLSGVGIFLCDKTHRPANLRVLGGCAFLTGSVFCMLTVFMGQHSLLSRLSLGDGLLRRYIFALLQNSEATLFVSTLTVTCIGGLLLLSGILWQVFANNTCKTQENVIE